MNSKSEYQHAILSVKSQLENAYRVARDLRDPVTHYSVSNGFGSLAKSITELLKAIDILAQRIDAIERSH